MIAPSPHLTEREMRRLEEIGRGKRLRVGSCSGRPVVTSRLMRKGLVFYSYDKQGFCIAVLDVAGRALLSERPEFEHLRKGSPS